jgi:hypothetical protein
MKNILALCAILFLSCNTTKKATTENVQKTSETAKAETQCPEPGKCSWEYLRNKSLVVEKDGIDMLYPHLVDNPETSVIKFRYHKDSPAGVSDGQYTEEVYFEVRNDVKSLSLQDEQLQEVKLLYGRMCFCERGKVGYVKVVDGKLSYTKTNGTASISLSFQNNKIPQVIQELQGTVDLGK